MAAAQSQPIFTETEYLAYDLAHDGKHEYVDGHIVAMTGAQPTHTRLVRNLVSLISPVCKQRGCEVFMLDQRVKVGNDYCYPDIVVSCEQPRWTNDNPASLTNPTVLVEVTSPTTEDAADFGWKPRKYKRIASLQQYVVIGCPTPSGVVWTRTGPRSWVEVDVEDVVTIAGVELRMADIYEGVAAIARQLDER